MINHIEKKMIVGLSPMAGYTDSAFRSLVRELCPEVYLVTELISSDGLKYNSKKTNEMMKHFQNEKPLVIQLFGKRPECFKYAVRAAEDAGASGIDINMGCPARKVIHSGHGSSLIKTPELAYEIVEACVSTTKLPVSVKTRIGWSKEETDYETMIQNLISFCKGIEKSGASLICIHGRTVKQEYSGISDFNPIYEVKKNVNIPVIGNGDIKTTKDAKEKIQNLDGVFIGRGTIGKPWIIPQIYAFLNNKTVPKEPDFNELKRIIIRHTELALEMKGRKGILEMRKNLISYLKCYPNAKEYRSKLVHVENIQEIKDVLDEYEKQNMLFH